MKIAIIGTSNIGALKYAAPRIADAYPSVDLTFYGMPGAQFDSCAVNDDGLFHPPQGDSEMCKRARRINGTVRLDLAAFDHILVVGDTLGLPNALWTAHLNDIAEWPTRREGHLLMSEAAFASALSEAIAARADHIRAQFRDYPLHLARAPYPTEAVARPGPHHQMPYAAMATHPEAARIETRFDAALHGALRTRAITLVPQPPETIARPFLTKIAYGQNALDFRDHATKLDDHRHMNADFGASLFRTFALSIGLTDHVPKT